MFFSFNAHGGDFMKKLADCRNNSDSLLIDCRTPNEFHGSSIRHAINIPVDQIATILEAYPDRELPIYLYCHSGQRSKSALGFLTKFGYTKVVNLGGILDYKPSEDVATR